VSLRGARIGRSLSCTGATFKSERADECAFDAKLAIIGADALLDSGFNATGGVIIAAIQIGRDLKCSQGSFRTSGEQSLDAENGQIGGSVYLSDGFSANRKVDLSGVQIGGVLDCHGGSFESLTLSKGNVKRSLFWNQVRDTEHLDLTDTHLGVLISDQKSWPKWPGSLDVDGQTYDRMSGDLLRNV